MIFKRRGSLSFCTIVTRNHLPRARSLGRSLREHHPDADYYVVVVDGFSRDLDIGEGARLLQSGDLEEPRFAQLAFRYNARELCRALKPSALAAVLRRSRSAGCVYLDSDIRVLEPLEELARVLERSSVALTPHRLSPSTWNPQDLSERGLLQKGAYDAGIVALRDCKETRGFLSWWRDRLRRKCHDRRQEPWYYDQKWLDYVPCFFPSSTILRDETRNVARWNAAQLGIASCAEAGSEDLNLEYGFSRFRNGTPIHRVFRELYAKLGDGEVDAFGDPFSSGAGSFFEWALRSAEVLPDAAGALPVSSSSFRVEWGKPTVPSVMRPDETFFAAVSLRNTSDQTWPDRSASPLTLDGQCATRLAYRWLRPGLTASPLDYEGRTDLFHPLAPGGSVMLSIEIVAPSTPGEYRLQFDLVREFAAWFEDRGGQTLIVPLSITGTASGRLARFQKTRAPSP